MIISFLKKTLINFLDEAGRLAITTGTFFKCAVKPPFRLKLIFSEMENIGANSIFIVILTGFFTGMVFALETGRVFMRFQAEGTVGSVVAMAVFRELGPVMAALMITARAGSAMAAQIGTMKVTQQIDALNTMAVEPVSYLVVPRVIAATIMMPILVGIIDFIAIFGAWLVGVGMLEIGEGIFFDYIEWMVDVKDITDGLFKSMFFGFIIAIVCCHNGLRTEKGALGVGKSTTKAVVLSSVLILVADYILTSLLF
ncbi:MAG: ABC transporter permease [Pseudomonadota bacterium]